MVRAAGGGEAVERDVEAELESLALERRGGSRPEAVASSDSAVASMARPGRRAATSGQVPVAPRGTTTSRTRLAPARRP
jgi:hypothetical protein